MLTSQIIVGVQLTENNINNANYGDEQIKIREIAAQLCKNRYANNIDLAFENKAIGKVKSTKQIYALTKEILLLFDAEDGELRIGAAELWGKITPPSMSEEIIQKLQEHLEVNFTRDFMCAGFQCDEEDNRSVSECAELSIRQLKQSR